MPNQRVFWKVLKFISEIVPLTTALLNTISWLPREGVIIECPLIHLFHNARDVILTSRNGVRQLDDDDDDDDDEPTLDIYNFKSR